MNDLELFFLLGHIWTYRTYLDMFFIHRESIYSDKWYDEMTPRLAIGGGFFNCGIDCGIELFLFRKYLIKLLNITLFCGW